MVAVFSTKSSTVNCSQTRMYLLFSLSLYIAMRETEIKLNKLYYSIGEVSDMFGVNTSLIRFWEKEFSIIKPKKNKKGNRLFTQKDIKSLRKIYQLVKVEGYTLEGAKQKLKKKKDKSETEPNHDKVVDLLKGIKNELEVLKSRL